MSPTNGGQSTHHREVGLVMRRRAQVRAEVAASLCSTLLLLSSCSAGGSPQNQADPAPTNTATGRATDVATMVSTAVREQLAESGSRLEGLQAVVVVRDGKTVFERYYGTTAGEFHDIRSVTKSVMSTLIGIAIADGAISGVKATLAELLPAYREVMTPAVARTTLGQVLSMTAGLPDNWDGQVGDRWVFASDPVKAILATPVRPPGEQFAYSDTGPQLLGAILEQATGQPLLDYARKKLLDPLGIDTRPAAQPEMTARGEITYRHSDFAWPVDSTGLNLGAGRMKLRPRDMANFGSLFLDQGQWHGRQLVPSAWVAAATSQHASAVGLGGADVGYGYMWWVGETHGHPAFLAWGFGGQVIRVVPDLGLVIVVSTDLPSPDSEGAKVESVLLLTDDVIVPILDR